VADMAVSERGVYRRVYPRLREGRWRPAGAAATDGVTSPLNLVGLVRATLVSRVHRFKRLRWPGSVGGEIALTKAHGNFERGVPVRRVIEAPS